MVSLFACHLNRKSTDINLETSAVNWTISTAAVGSFVVQPLGSETLEVRFPQCGPRELLDSEAEILPLLANLKGRQLHLHAGSMMCSMPASQQIAQRLAEHLQAEGRAVVSSGFWYQQTSLRQTLPEMLTPAQSAGLENLNQNHSGEVISLPA